MSFSEKKKEQERVMARMSHLIAVMMSKRKISSTMASFFTIPQAFPSRE